MMRMTDEYIESYAAAHSTSVLIDRSTQEGRFELLDRDRLDLLHRMSTNDFTTLKPGEGRETVLTTALARIIDRLIVYHRGETALALCGDGRIAAVRGWLQRHIFFQDKVRTRDMSSTLAQFGLYGANAGAVAEQLAPGVSALPLHHFIETTFDGTPLMIARSFPLAGDSYVLLIPTESRTQLQSALLSLEGVQVAEPSTYELLRIEAGIPASGHELTEEYIPLETGLWEAVSFKKGCYIGQEIIARMESRNKLARSLVQLRLPAFVPTGTALHSEDRVVGSVTSTAGLPAGGAVALGYVKTDALDAPLSVMAESGERLTAEIAHLPQR